MFISKIIETSNGTVEFKGEFSEAEHSFLLEFALQTLIERGLLPIKISDAEDLHNHLPPATQAQ